MKTVNLTIAGTCTNDPGRGGWAFVLRMGEHSMERTGGSPHTIRAQIEMNAVIEGLRALQEPCEVLLFSESRHLLEGISSWRHKWRANGWARRRKMKTYPLANSDLWKELDQLAEKHVVKGQWIKGHSGHPDNERCDMLAAAQASLHVDVPSWSSLIA